MFLKMLNCDYMSDNNKYNDLLSHKSTFEIVLIWQKLCSSQNINYKLRDILVERTGKDISKLLKEEFSPLDKSNPFYIQNDVRMGGVMKEMLVIASLFNEFEYNDLVIKTVNDDWETYDIKKLPPLLENYRNSNINCDGSKHDLDMFIYENNEYIGTINITTGKNTYYCFHIDNEKLEPYLKKTRELIKKMYFYNKYYDIGDYHNDIKKFKSN